MDSRTIGELAAAAGVPVSTIRFHERAGLLRADFRTSGNFRGYGPDALARLKFIRSAQATGCSVRDITELLNLTPSPEPPCGEVRALLRVRLADVRKRLKDLRQVEKVLSRTLKACCGGGGPDLCDEIVRLKTVPSTTRRATNRRSVSRA